LKAIVPALLNTAPWRVFDSAFESRGLPPLGGFVLKRTVDIALAGCLLALSLPFLVLAAIVIRMDSRGPVLFFQTRVGRGFSRFRIWKLRTMRVGGAGPSFTLGDDSRVTRAGRWLRRFKVDELPQLWNVLRGDMSLVGPRPVVPDLIEGFEEAYTRLLAVRPGLTDPATIKYCREEECLSRVVDQTLYYKTMMIPDKVRLSIAYLEHASLSSDLVLIAETVLVLIPRNCEFLFIRGWFLERWNMGRWLFLRPVHQEKAEPVPGKM
jgi:lipopolysaccharide/colanic/teichoic acid biosynthesis glycosyltransferase